MAIGCCLYGSYRPEAKVGCLEERIFRSILIERALRNFSLQVRSGPIGLQILEVVTIQRRLCRYRCKFRVRMAPALMREIFWQSQYDALLQLAV